MDAISQVILQIRSAAGNPNKVCPTCGRSPETPYRVLDQDGSVIHGCVDAIHTAHVDRYTVTGYWHFRKEAIQLRQQEMVRLRSIVNPRLS
jgi:hypothetical protein